MNDIEIRLMNTYQKLVDLRCNSTQKFDSQCQLKDLTHTQIDYLKIIDRHEFITLSKLAKEVNNSKPTVTEMVKKFIAVDCIYKEKCDNDGRKAYIMLTERGKKIAHMEEHVLSDVVRQLVNKLNDEEIETFIDIIEKVVSD